MMTSPRAYQQPGLGPPSQSASVNVPSRSADRLSPFHIRPGHIATPSSFPRQFQALFDSLFKVLFIFPSRYLFAIVPTEGSHPLWRPASGDLGQSATLRGASPDYNSDAEGDRFSWWAFPAPPDLRSRWERACTQRVVDGSRTDRLARDWSRAWLIHHFITAKSAMNPDFNQPRGGCSREVSIHPAQQHCYMFALGRALGLMASGATCVQRLDGSRDSAIHTKYRISLRSSSMQEPRYPLPRVIRTAHVAAIRTLHRTIQSVGATGGVYKGQGRCGEGFCLANLPGDAFSLWGNFFEAKKQMMADAKFVGLLGLAIA
ncbi:putative uncharacterized protein ART3 [Glycine soja]